MLDSDKYSPSIACSRPEPVKVQTHSHVTNRSISSVWHFLIAMCLALAFGFHFQNCVATFGRTVTLCLALAVLLQAVNSTVLLFTARVKASSGFIIFPFVTNLFLLVFVFAWTFMLGFPFRIFGLTILVAVFSSSLHLLVVTNTLPQLSFFSNKSGRLVPFLQNTSLSLFMLVLFPVSAEISARSILGQPHEAAYGYGDRYDFVVAPYVMFAEPPLGRGGTLNTQGFRGDEVRAAKRPNEIRIATIGGSAVWSGERSGESIAVYLESALQSRYPTKTIRVINFGRQSYVSAQELILLQRNILPLDMDIIIVYDGFNDVWVPHYAEASGVGNPFLFSNLQKRVEQSNKIINFGQLDGYLAQRSILLQKIRPFEEKAAFHGFDLDEDGLLKEFRRNIFQIAALSNIYGSKVIFSVQPYVGSRKQPAGDEGTFLDRPVVEELERIFTKLQEAARDIAKSSGNYYVTTRDVFDEFQGQIYVDPVHVYPKTGNEIIAKRFAAFIDEVGLIR